MTPAHRDSFFQDGFVVLEGYIEREFLARLQRGLQEMLSSAAQAPANDPRFDIASDDSTAPRACRRINDPHRIDPAFDQLLRLPRMLDAVAALIGEDIVFEDMPLNVKPPSAHEAIGWHQDWAFLPRTNDRAVTVTIHLVDTNAGNGAMAVIPGTHTMPQIFDHHRDGVFAGRIDPRDPLVPWDREVLVAAPAGAICIHHARTVHGSRPNGSDAARPVQAIGFHAADAWPLLDLNDATELELRGKLLRGTMRPPALVANPVKLPYPRPRERGSIFRVQNGGGDLFVS